MMSYEMFCQQIQHLLMEKFEEGAQIHLHDVQKNNGVVKKALCILEKGSNVSPTLYLHEYYAQYESGMSMEKVAEELWKEYMVNRASFSISAAEYTDFEKARSNLAYKLVNYEKNESLLAKVPHRRYLDLAVVYYLLIDNYMIGKGTAIIYNELLEAWNVTEETLYETAKVNTGRLLGVEITRIDEVIEKLLYEDLKEQMVETLGKETITEDDVEAAMTGIAASLRLGEAKEIYVYSNYAKYYGAACLLDQSGLEAFAEMRGSFFVVPSSVHEVILVPEEVMLSEKEVLELLKEINDTSEDGTEYLSNKLYYYDKDKKCVKISRERS